MRDLDQLSILDQTSDAIIITDLDGTIIFWNQQAEKLIKLRGEDVLGRSIFDAFIPHVDMSTGIEIVESFNREGEWFGEIPIQSSDGRRFIVSVTSTLLKNKEGEPIGIIGLGRDVTQRKQIERELEEKAKELRRSNEELNRFAYIASHDLQEPLRTISFFTGLLEREVAGKLNGKEKDYLDLILEGTKRMQELIEDLLEYSRVETRGKDFVKVDMNHVADRVLLSLDSSINGSQAEVDVDRLPTINGDQTQMIQLLTNLISNAIKFRANEPPKIEVSAMRKNDEYVFSVKDNGIGIDPKYQDKLFKMFQRLHTKEEYPGTGIGLAICKKIVERHGGRIWFESEPGKGTTF
ncbi:MAG: ATP-binding protein, partial [Methanomassiliicoccus sp.]|nr:ATP-binding protein [Methanomassiliicoccus sp.]